MSVVFSSAPARLLTAVGRVPHSRIHEWEASEGSRPWHCTGCSGCLWRGVVGPPSPFSSAAGDCVYLQSALVVTMELAVEKHRSVNKGECAARRQVNDVFYSQTSVHSVTLSGEFIEESLHCWIIYWILYWYSTHTHTNSNTHSSEEHFLPICMLDLAVTTKSVRIKRKRPMYVWI